MNETLAYTAAALAAAAATWPLARRRLELSLAKHPSLAGHSRLAKRVAALVPGYAYDEERFFDSDGAPADVVARRREGFFRLVGQLASRHPAWVALTQQKASGSSTWTAVAFSTSPAATA